MQNTPVLLSSPNPLPNECEKQWRIYLIAAGSGLLLGLMPGLLAFNLPVCLLLGSLGGLLGLGIGWGIADIVAKTQCLYLRTLQFRLPAPLNTTELYSQLAPQLASMNIPLEMTTEGNLRITYNGIFYTICYVNKARFTINWSQSLGKALLNRGFYGKLYKKLITGMGFIGYYVQQACNPLRQVQFSTTILPTTGKNSDAQLNPPLQNMSAPSANTMTYATPVPNQQNMPSPLWQCPYCHATISTGSRFCGSCGRQLTN